MHIQRLANAWIAYLNTPSQKVAEQHEDASAMQNKNQDILHFITLPINLE
jgi:hypothetical protein